MAVRALLHDALEVPDPLCQCECHANRPAEARRPVPRGRTRRTARGAPAAGRDGRRR